MHCLTLTQSLRDNLLGFHAFTSYDTTSEFSSLGQRVTWNYFLITRILCRGLVVMEHLHKLDNLCLTCMAHLSSQLSTMPEFTFSVRPNLVCRYYHQQETSWKFTPRSPTIRQRSDCRQARSTLYIPSAIDISTWTMKSDCLKTVWTRLLAILDACLELVPCGYKAKCRKARCNCFKTDLHCMYACGCDGVDCCSSAGQ